MGSIASGLVAAEDAAIEVRERKAEIERLEARLKAPRPQAPDVKKIRAALEQTTKDWREVLRGQPRA